ncbi:hypothetical protein OH77DRAFT_1518557 [Trametes cingulata]|nr:hypothetical protein OH77DRAFT_1518557 [Trametes cingulata]
MPPSVDIGIDQIIDETASERMLTPIAVATQVGLMLGGSLAMLLLFNVFRTKDERIYGPNLKRQRLPTGGQIPNTIITGSLLRWIHPLYQGESQLVDGIGLDAVIYLRFLRMCRRLFTAIACLTCAVLLPVNIRSNILYIKLQARDVLSMLTIRDVENPNWIFAHIAMTYIITILVIAFLLLHLWEVDSLGEKWEDECRSADRGRRYAFLVTNIPVERQSDDGLLELLNFKSSCLEDEGTAQACIGLRMDRLLSLLDEGEKTRRALDALNNESPRAGQPARARDTQPFLKEKLKYIDIEVKKFRETSPPCDPEDYGFAWMAITSRPTRPDRYAALRDLQKNARASGANVTFAPEDPKEDIIWNKLRLRRPSDLRRRQIIGWTGIVLVCFFNTVPLLIISTLANLASLTAYVPFLFAWSEASPASFAFVSGVTPPAISALFGMALPAIMRDLIEYMGAYTYSSRDHALATRYHHFLVVSQLIVFTLIGVIFNLVKQVVNLLGQHQSAAVIVQVIDRLPAIVFKAYVDQASYWLTYYPLTGALVLFDLTQIVPLVQIRLKDGIFGTPRMSEEAESVQPRYFPYATNYSTLLFLSTVGLFFAPLAPLVCVAAAVVFWITSWAHEYQLLFVFTTKHATGVRLWNVVVNGLLVGVLLMQAVMMLTMMLSFGFRSYSWLYMAPAMFLVLAFKSCEGDIRNLNAKSYARDGMTEGMLSRQHFEHPALRKVKYEHSHEHPPPEGNEGVDPEQSLQPAMPDMASEEDLPGLKATYSLSNPMDPGATEANVQEGRPQPAADEAKENADSVQDLGNPVFEGVLAGRNMDAQDRRTHPEVIATGPITVAYSNDSYFRPRRPHGKPHPDPVDETLGES